jgi:hypothetical protein
MGIDPAIEGRVTALLARGIRAEVLIEEVAVAQVAATRGRLGRAVDAVSLDAADAAREAVVAWLRSLPVSHDAQVTVLWPHYRGGISLRYEDFARLYDELWYPAADDVWVIAPGEDWILEVGHEEVFTLKNAISLAGPS